MADTVYTPPVKFVDKLSVPIVRNSFASSVMKLGKIIANEEETSVISTVIVYTVPAGKTFLLYQINHYYPGAADFWIFFNNINNPLFFTTQPDATTVSLIYSNPLIFKAGEKIAFTLAEAINTHVGIVGMEITNTDYDAFA